MWVQLRETQFERWMGKFGVMEWEQVDAEENENYYRAICMDWYN